MSKKLLFIIITLLLLMPFAIKANVVINEIAWMGTTENWRHEWLELYANESTSLDGWKIELYRDNLDFTIELSGTIENYFLIVASDVIFTNYDLNYSNLGGKLNNSGQRIILKNNQGGIVDEINCFSEDGWLAGDNSTKQTMERVSGGWQTSLDPGGTPKAQNSSGDTGETEPPTEESPPVSPQPSQPASSTSNQPASPDGGQGELPVADAGNNIITFIGEEITFDGSKSYDPDGGELAYEWNLGEGGVKEDIVITHQYSFPGTYLVSLRVYDGLYYNTDTITVEVYPKKITINEFLPSPVGKDAEEEWIELYNDSDQIINISGWQLDDEDGGSKPFIFPENTLIAPKSYLVFSRPATGIVLNNDSDKVRLLLSTKVVFQKVSYEKAKEGLSSALTPQGFVWSTPTPGLPNIVPSTSSGQAPEYTGSLQSKTTNQPSQDTTLNYKPGNSIEPKEVQKNYYNLANLEESTNNNNKLVLIILTIIVVAFGTVIGILKLKKKY